MTTERLGAAIDVGWKVVVALGVLWMALGRYGSIPDRVALLERHEVTTDSVRLVLVTEVRSTNRELVALTLLVSQALCMGQAERERRDAWRTCLQGGTQMPGQP